jgi:4-hydroxybenzoate polyprenyltransferase
MRPLPSGHFSPASAVVAAIFLLAVGISLAFLLEWKFGTVSVAYMVSTLAYSFYLKNVALVDAMIVASGFLLRAVAGAVVLGLTVSPWLYAGTGAGALLISFGKRRNELIVMGQDAAQHRGVLAEYNHPQLMDQLIAVMTSSTLITYALYTFLAPNLPDNHGMMLTIPFVLYGIFRYLYLIYHKNLGGTPEEVLLSDGPMLANVVLWLGSAAAILVIFR